MFFCKYGKPKVHSLYLRTTRWQRNRLTGDIDTIFVQQDATVGLDEVFSRRIGHQGRISSDDKSSNSNQPKGQPVTSWFTSPCAILDTYQPSPNWTTHQPSHTTTKKPQLMLMITLSKVHYSCEIKPRKN